MATDAARRGSARARARGGTLGRVVGPSRFAAPRSIVPARRRARGDATARVAKPDLPSRRGVRGVHVAPRRTFRHRQHDVHARRSAGEPDVRRAATGATAGVQPRVPQADSLSQPRPPDRGAQPAAASDLGRGGRERVVRAAGEHGSGRRAQSANGRHRRGRGIVGAAVGPAALGARAALGSTTPDGRRLPTQRAADCRIVAAARERYARLGGHGSARRGREYLVHRPGRSRLGLLRARAGSRGEAERRRLGAVRGRPL